MHLTGRCVSKQMKQQNQTAQGWVGMLGSALAKWLPLVRPPVGASRRPAHGLRQGALAQSLLLAA